MSGPVLWNVDPDPREGLLSLIVNTVARNLLPSAHTIIQQVGAAHAHTPMVALNPDLDIERLAWILRQPKAEVERRWHPPAGADGLVSSFGCSVRADEIGFGTRRFGPTAVGEAPVARALWSLKTVPCCNEHWEYLTDVCGCGAVQRWQSADRLDRCDACNARLADAPAVKVEPALRENLGFLLGLLDPDPDRRSASRNQLPADLVHLDGGIVFELALALVPLASGGYQPVRGSFCAAGAAQIAYSSALAATADLVRGWPGAFISAIGEEVAALSRASNKPGYTGIADYVPAMANPSMPSLVREAFQQALAPITATASQTPDDQVGMKEAQTALAVTLGVLSHARREGHLQTRVCLRAGKLFATLDRKEMDAISDLKANRISAEMASEELNLPGYAMNLIDGTDAIGLVRHPFIQAYYGGPQLHRSELARFRKALAWKAAVLLAGEDVEEALRGALDNPVPLHRVARAMGGGFKPWGRILDRLLDGSTRFAMSAPRMSRIWVAAEDARRLQSLEPASTGSALLPATCSQRDALEILNLPLRKADLLKTMAAASDSWEMQWDAVLKIAKERITLTEICARTGYQSKTVLAWIGPLDLRADDLGWWRDKALAAIEGGRPARK